MHKHDKYEGQKPIILYGAQKKMYKQESKMSKKKKKGTSLRWKTNLKIDVGNKNQQLKKLIKF